MKKTVVLILSLALALALSACGKSELQKATNTTADQAAEIERVLGELGIEYESISEMAETGEVSAYMLTTGDGHQYMMALHSKSLESIYDMDTEENLYTR